MKQQINFSRKLAIVLCLLSLMTLAVGPVMAQNLAIWDCAGTNGAATNAPDYAESGLTVSNLTLGTGLTATNYNGTTTDGLEAKDQLAMTLAEAIAGDEYIAFTLTPQSGKSVTISKISLRPFSQSHTRYFAVMSSASGFNEANVLGTVSIKSTTGSATLLDVVLANHQNISAPVEFRIYVYGYNNKYEAAGLAGTGDDLTVEGAVQNLLYSLTVLNGSGTGLYAPNSQVSIVADAAPSGQEFDKWIGDIGYLASATSASTTVDMIAAAIAVTATYKTVAPPPPPPASCNTLQAELNFTGDAVVKTANAGYAGTGYLDYGANGSYAQWTIEASQAGQATFKAVHANGGTTNRQCALIVNGVNVGNIAFAPTGSWTTWTETPEMSISLNAGANTIKVQANTSNGGPNLDQYTVCTTDGTPQPSSDATLSALTLSTGSLVPSFSASTLSYTASVANSVSSVTVSATATHSGATVSGTGTKTLVVGQNTINIVVTAEDGTTQNTYTVVISRQDAIDTQAPTKPGTPAVAAVTCNSISLSWTASTDNVGVVGYEVYFGSTLKTTTAQNSATIYGLSANTNYPNITVKAFDAAQNMSVASNAVSTSTTTCQQSENKNITGIGLSGPKDWEEAFIFADAMMSSRQWTGCSVDANGWPTGDGEIYVADIQNLHGTYKMKFTGNADISFNSATVSNKVYNAATNTTTCDVEITRSESFALKLTVTNSNGGIKNVKLMRPITPGSSISHNFDELIHREVKSFITSGFNLVRFMDFMGTNSDTYHKRANFSYRLTPNYATQAADWDLTTYVKKNPATGLNWFAYQGIGGAYEYVILMCNEMNVDCWINIPHCANDDHIRKMAQIFKYGSDGTNPYTSPQANPKYPPLNPNLKLYVEFSNEVWNWNFPQTGYINNNRGDLDWRQATAKRAAEMSVIFREVFGNSEMMTRVRPLFEWQKGKNTTDYGNAQLSGTMGLMWLEKNMPQPINYYFWGGGGSGYYGPDAGADINTVWNSGQMNSDAWTYPMQEWMAYLSASYGLRRAVYEGGPSFGDEYGGTAENSLGNLVLNDPRLADEMVEHQAAYNSVGGNVFTFFTISGDHRWGFINEPNTPNIKLQGAIAIKDQAREPITIATRVTPTTVSTIPGNRWKITNKTDGGYAWRNAAESDAAFTVGDGLWVSYPFHVTADGTYEVRVKSSGSGTVAIYDGSNLLGTYTIANGATPWVSFNATIEYLKAIRVKAVSGSVVISSIEIAGQSAQKSAALTNFDSEKGNSGVRIYPNPSNGGMITVAVADDTKSVNIAIFDIRGKLVYQQMHSDKNVQLSTVDFAKGIYIVHVQTDMSNVKSKLIIE